MGTVIAADAGSVHGQVALGSVESALLTQLCW